MSNRIITISREFGSGGRERKDNGVIAYHLRLRTEGYTEQEVADRVGRQTAGAIHKGISRIAGVCEGFVTEGYSHHRVLPLSGFAAAG